MTKLRGAKTGATDYAGKIVKAAGQYADTDQDLGNRLGQQQFGRNGGPGQPGNGGPGGGGSGGGGMGQMGEMMQMPMQMAGQALQAPMQMVGMIGSLPQTLMQGVQSLGGMAGLGGQHDKGDANSLDLPTDSQQDKDKQDQQGAPEDKHDEPKHQAAGPQRESLQPTPDLGPGASGERPRAPLAPVAPAPILPVMPGREIDL